MRKKKSPSRTKLYVGIALAGAALLGANSYFWLSGVPAAATFAESSAQETLLPVLYSDAHITENAIIADARYKDVAITRRSSFPATILLGLPQSRNLAPQSLEPEKGSWVWTPTLQITPEYRDAIIAGAQENGIRTIYLSIDSYLDVYMMPDGLAKARKQKAFDETVESFIRKARASGITVDAEAGWRNWAKKGHVYKAFAVLEYVKAFNAAHTEKFRGFQYDVEPYLLAEYHTDTAAVLSDYLDLVNETLVRLDNTDLLFSVVIPDFYDRTTPKFFYDLRLGYVLDHLFAMLERRSGSKVIVMAYRNQSDGKDGSIAISRGEIKASNRSNTKVVIAQETSDVPPASITFHKTSRAHLNTQIENIQNAFAKDKGYNGIAIHYINTLMALK